VNRPLPKRNVGSRLVSGGIVERLQQRAEQRGEAPSIEFVTSEGTGESVDRATLDLQVRRLAARLQAELAFGDRALLLLPPGLEFVRAFLACAYAGIVAVPVHPPSDALGMHKLAAIIARAEPAAVLSTAALQPSIADARVRWLDASALDGIDAADYRPPRIDGETLLFLQFTSGSTAAPKGVMISHTNVEHDVAMIGAAFGTHEPDARGVFWLPPQHDMGLVGAILTPLLDGVPATLMTPREFLRAPQRWLELISSRRASISGAPDFGYAYAARRIDAQTIAALDLSCWRTAFCGAEPIRVATLRSFADKFAPAGFRFDAFLPCYGLAEATLLVSGSHFSRKPSVASFDRAALERGRVEAPRAGEAVRELVGCGAVAEGQHVRIVDPERNVEVPDGEIGEVWVSGPNVARGYYADEAATAESFAAQLPGSPVRWLRTGDLGFLHAGELWITGRCKELIIVRGRNVHPQDVEAVVASVLPSALPSAVALAVERDGEERVVVLVEVGRVPEPDALARRIRSELARALELEIAELALVPRRTLTRTTSGKLQRTHARERWLAAAITPIHVSRSDGSSADLLDARELVASSPDERERMLLDALERRVAALLGCRPGDLDRNIPVERLGLDSLQLVELKLGLDRWLGREFDLDRFLERPTLVDVAKIAAALVEAPVAAQPEPVPVVQQSGVRPPGPARDPALLGAFVRDPFAFLSGLVAEHGDSVAFELGERSIYLFAGQREIQQVLVDDASRFAKGEVYQVLGKLMGAGMVTSESDDHWRNQRRAAQPMFGKQTVGDYTDPLEARVRRCFERWDGLAESGAPIDLLAHMRRLALGVVLGEFLHIEPDEPAHAQLFEQLFELVESIEDGIDIPPTFFQFDAGLRDNSRFRKTIERLDAVTEQLLEVSPRDADDFVSLLASTPAVREAGPARARVILRDAVISLIFAGTGTTSSSLFWTLLLLADRPKLLARLRDEVHERPLAPTILRDCPLLTAILCESLRLYPPIWWITRAATSATTVGDWQVPQDAVIFISPYVTHHNPRAWPRPDEFDVDRFLGAREAAFRTPNFLPFGLGRRACIGGRFSMHEMAVILALCVARYEFVRLDDAPRQSGELATTLSLVPRQRVRFRLARRTECSS
jgi:acyl-CoA synthetase (AMP-forming)/AMP-acid ligase II/cytochrome P450